MADPTELSEPPVIAMDGDHIVFCTGGSTVKLTRDDTLRFADALSAAARSPSPVAKIG